MPQEFWILECYSCKTFQVHQKQKSKKWECKMCGEKQSIKKIYFEGSGRDCRINVQKLNLAKGQCSETFNDDVLTNPNDSQVITDLSPLRSSNHHEDCVVTSLSWSETDNNPPIHEPSQCYSKWTKFVEPESDDENHSKNMLSGDCSNLHPSAEENSFCQGFSEKNIMRNQRKRKVFGDNSLSSGKASMGFSKRKATSPSLKPTVITNKGCSHENKKYKPFNKASENAVSQTKIIDQHLKEEKKDKQHSNKSLLDYFNKQPAQSSSSVEVPQSHSKWTKFCDSKNESSYSCEEMDCNNDSEDSLEELSDLLILD